MAESFGDNPGRSYGRCIGCHRDNLVRAALEKTCAEKARAKENCPPTGLA
jgi:hypothetical protein